MKQLFSLIIGSLLMIGISYDLSSQLDEMPCEVENTTWLSGEELTYKVYYNWQFIWIPAGEAKFKVTENEDSYDFLVTGETSSTYDGLFKVRDRYYSRVSKESGQPEYFVRMANQGKYVRYDSLSFDYENGVIHEWFGKSKETAEYFQFDMDHCTQDMVSILYHLRNYEESNITPGSQLPINVFFDKEYYDLDIKVNDVFEERIKGIGKQEVIHLTPELVSGEVFTEGNEMDIYVSNDECKIPLLIESAVSVGSIKAVLVDTKNTKHNPLN
jgi:hypothetical protein